MDDWKIEKRKPGCTACGRAFAGEEPHVSAIAERGGRFERRDQCLACWEKRAEEPFSFWRTAAPKRAQRRLEDVAAMVEFFKRLIEKPCPEPGRGADPDETRAKITYLTALLLMRKKRVKAAGSRQRDGRTLLVLEKSWDGETVEIADPPITDAELESLKTELERLFSLELGREALARP